MHVDSAIGGRFESPDFSSDPNDVSTAKRGHTHPIRGPLPKGQSHFECRPEGPRFRVHIDRPYANMVSM
jgi:hypothetical protein